MCMQTKGKKRNSTTDLRQVGVLVPSLLSSFVLFQLSLSPHLLFFFLLPPTYVCIHPSLHQPTQPTNIPLKKSQTSQQSHQHPKTKTKTPNQSHQVPRRQFASTPTTTPTSQNPNPRNVGAIVVMFCFGFLKKTSQSITPPPHPPTTHEHPTLPINLKITPSRAPSVWPAGPPRPASSSRRTLRGRLPRPRPRRPARRRRGWGCWGRGVAPWRIGSVVCFVLFCFGGGGVMRGVVVGWVWSMPSQSMACMHAFMHAHTRGHT